MKVSKKIIIVGTIVALLAVGGTLYALNAKKNDDTAKTTSTSETAQSDYTGGAARPNDSEGVPQGGAVDTQGSGASNTPGGISSESGVITVQQPLKDNVIASGVVVAGKASGLDNVQYRLIDDQVGVLAQGALKVKDGAFSGTLQFTPRASSGRLDIFSYDSTGKEINTIEINVRFKD